MKRIVMSIALCAIAFPALAEQIPDYSISQEEMVHNTNNSTQPLNPNANPPINATSINPYRGAPVTNIITNSPANNPYAPPPNSQDNPAASRRFMDGYCSNSFTPAIANDPRYAATADCIKRSKEQVCAQFQQLPPDAQNVLDQTIGCNNKLLNGDAQDPRSSGGAMDGCTTTDGSRLQLLKKYWRDMNTAYALVFMPDDVLDGSTKCVRGGQ